MEDLRATETKKSTFIDRLRLECWSPKYFGKHIVLVEGDDDVDFYTNLFMDNCFIKPTSGCENILAYHNMLNASWTETCHIAIKDADFDRANGTMVSAEGFFYTDYHDHEMMATSSDAFMTDMLAACGSPHSVEDVRRKIFDDLHVLSMFRWYNHTEHTNLSCRKGVDIIGASVADLQNPTWLMAQYMRTAVNQNPEKHITASIVDFGAFCCMHTLNDFELTNGHNFVSRFCGVAEGDMSRYPFTLIDEIVQTYYQVQYFRSTQLYADISGWETSHVKILK